ncbi:hypothetical protein Bca4012_037581 [Brassica carinata]
MKIGIYHKDKGALPQQVRGNLSVNRRNQRPLSLIFRMTGHLQSGVSVDPPQPSHRELPPRLLPCQEKQGSDSIVPRSFARSEGSQSLYSSHSYAETASHTRRRRNSREPSLVVRLKFSELMQGPLATGSYDFGHVSWSPPVSTTYICLVRSPFPAIIQFAFQAGDLLLGHISHKLSHASLLSASAEGPTYFQKGLQKPSKLRKEKLDNTNRMYGRRS